MYIFHIAQSTEYTYKLISIILGENLDETLRKHFDDNPTKYNVEITFWETDRKLKMTKFHKYVKQKGDEDYYYKFLDKLYSNRRNIHNYVDYIGKK